MCDTLGALAPAGALFAKNSDRSPNEPQLTEFHPAANPTGPSIKATYREIPSAGRTHGMLLSRPAWMWGGEMGVNDCAVAIGNEAVFTRGRYGKTGLTGMDLLRLALERAAEAKEALDTILSLLEAYGQGGSGGYDHPFYYDNSFLIMDPGALYILETAGRKWVWRRAESGAISNALTLGDDGDAYSEGAAYDFTRNRDPLYTHFSGSATRRRLTAACAVSARSAADLMAGLRAHAPGVAHPLTRGTVASPCMHAGGLVGDHTTASMVAELAGEPRLWLTGCSTPCISLYKPYALGNPPAAPVFAAGDRAAQGYWLERERFHRAAVGRVLPEDFYRERDALQAHWLARADKLSGGALHALSADCAREEAAFYEKWTARLPGETQGARRFRRYWRRKNAALGQPRAAQP